MLSWTTSCKGGSPVIGSEQMTCGSDMSRITYPSTDHNKNSSIYTWIHTKHTAVNTHTHSRPDPLLCRRLLLMWESSNGAVPSTNHWSYTWGLQPPFIWGSDSPTVPSPSHPSDNHSPNNKLYMQSISNTCLSIHTFRLYTDIIIAFFFFFFYTVFFWHRIWEGRQGKILTVANSKRNQEPLTVGDCE